jgi:hypothetical protein
LEVTNHQLRFVIYTLLKIFGNVSFRKNCSTQDLADFEKVSPATGVNSIMDGSTGDGTPIANGFLSPLFSRDFFVILENKEI